MPWVVIDWFGDIYIDQIRIKFDKSFPEVDIKLQLWSVISNVFINFQIILLFLSELIVSVIIGAIK